MSQMDWLNALLHYIQENVGCIQRCCMNMSGVLVPLPEVAAGFSEEVFDLLSLLQQLPQLLSCAADVPTPHCKRKGL